MFVMSHDTHKVCNSVNGSKQSQESSSPHLANNYQLLNDVCAISTLSL